MDDAKRWNERYRNAEPPIGLNPHPLVESAINAGLPGTAIDVACGLADSGLHLATLGVEVCCADVSPVALDLVKTRASQLSVEVSTEVFDSTSDPMPSGPWDMIVCLHYLDRELLKSLGDHLAPSGRLIVAIATEENLTRHERPSARFLLKPGELPGLIRPDLEVEHFDEAWRSNDTHEAWLVARRGDDQDDRLEAIGEKRAQHGNELDLSFEQL